MYALIVNNNYIPNIDGTKYEINKISYYILLLFKIVFLYMPFLSVYDLLEST